jgi:hypothetical protein
MMFTYPGTTEVAYVEGIYLINVDKLGRGGWLYPFIQGSHE